jgi:two-component system chemotaxis response regulator CheB
MTGMGEDGADGLRAVQAAGGLTIAQSPESCVVDSMPRAAIERGYTNRVVALDALPSVLQTLCMSDSLRHHVNAGEVIAGRGTPRES